MSEILHSTCKQYGIPYCSTEHVMFMYNNVCVMMVTVTETCSNFTALQRCKEMTTTEVTYN